MTVRFSPLIELFYDGVWNDITGDVYMRDRISISRGQADEGSTADPGKMSLTLDNRDGRYSPRNPAGALFGKIGRNTPIRVSTENPAVAADDFNRTVSGSWGTATSGQAWSQTGTGGTVDAADFEVDGAEAIHHVETTSAYRFNYLSALSLSDVDVTVSVRVPLTDITGGAVEPANILLRGQNVNDYYMARVEILADETIQASIHKNGASSGLLSSVKVLSFSHSAGQILKVRFQALGKMLRLKVWRATEAEPPAWTTAIESALITSAGWVGVRSGVASGNTNTKPVDFFYDDLAVTDLSLIRFVGEVASWTPRRDVSQNDKHVQVEAAGILRRLGQGDSPVMSPLRRFLSTNPATVAYWPCEEAGTSEVGSGLPGSSPMTVVGTPEPGAADVWPATAPLPVMKDASFSGAVSAYESTGELLLHCFGKPPETPATGDEKILQLHTTGTIDRWDFSQPNTNDQIAVHGYSGTTLVVNNTASSTTIAGRPADIRLELKQNGANIDWKLFWITDIAAQFISGTATSQTLGTAKKIVAAPGRGYTDGVIGHISLSNSIAAFENTLAVLAAHNGETARGRLTRLCEEHGIPFAYVVKVVNGAVLQSTAMGRQQIDTLPNLLQEAAAAEGGILHETRHELGLTLRQRASLYNQTAAVTLDFAAGHISPPWDPDEDDQGTRNDITVTRRDGSSARAELKEGRMSTQAPPAGVGRYDEAVTLSLQRDHQANDHAGWKLHLGTWDEQRFPGLAVDLAKNASLRPAVWALESGDKIDITNAPTDDSPDDIEQIVQGYSETFDLHWWDWTPNCTPAGPWYVWTLGDAVHGRLDTAGSEIASGATTATDAGNSTTTYIVVPDSQAGGFAISDKAQIFTSAGALKEPTVFTVTDKQSAFGFTNISVSPSFAAAPVAGDQIKRADDATLLVATDSGKKLWVTTASHPSAFPFAVRFGGEVAKVTGITGATSPQEFTFARGFNGVFKAHPAGTRLRLARVAVTP